MLLTDIETGIYSYPIQTWHQKIKSINAAITMHSHTQTHINISVCTFFYRTQAYLVSIIVQITA